MPKIDKALYEELERRNAEIDAARDKAYQESMGVQAVLFMNLPQRLTIFDLLRERGITIPPYNIAVCGNNGYQTFNTIAELAVALQVNLGRSELEQILSGSFKGMTISLGSTYEPELRAYVDSFEGEAPPQQGPQPATTSYDSQLRRRQYLI